MAGARRGFRGDKKLLVAVKGCRTKKIARNAMTLTEAMLII